MQTLPPNKSLAVDVDGTLITAGGAVDPEVVRFIREARARGCNVTLWSSRGREHAEAAAARAGRHLFDAVISKPELIIDDRLWTWIKYAPAVHPARLNHFTWKPLPEDVETKPPV